MSDTPRTKAALLALFADNVVGAISAQDFRDLVATIMPEEFVNEYDFWCEPKYWATALTDKMTRGDHMYSQIVGSNISISFGKIYALTASNTWSTANVSASLCNFFLGVAGDSYASGATNAKFLIRGMVYDSSLSARFSNYVGYPIYLQSDLDGSYSITITTNSALKIGVVMPSAIGQSADNVGNVKWYFQQEWTVSVGAGKGSG